MTAQLVALLSDPNVGFILMTVAIFGIIFELSNPGAILPGVIGGVALILTCVSFAVVTVSSAGLLLIAFSLVLFVADIKLPSHGVLTAGGIVAFVLGSLILTGSNVPSMRVSLPLILTVAGLTAAFFMFAVAAGVRAQSRVVRTGREAIVDALGIARTELAPDGTVFVEGELWKAKTSDSAIPAGTAVRVLSMTGLRLNVRAAKHPEWEGME
ncbi:MAG: NfeD family protein [Candidatus Elarobacter sp.]